MGEKGGMQGQHVSGRELESGRSMRLEAGGGIGRVGGERRLEMVTEI